MDIIGQQLVNALQLGSAYALLAVGYTMVYGVLRLINFAHADIFMLGAYMGFFAFNVLGLASGVGAFIISVALAMIGAAILAVGIERIAYRPLRKAPRLSAMITAIGVSLFLEHGSRAVPFIGPAFRRYPDIIPRTRFEIGGVYLTGAVTVVLITSIILMIVLSYIVSRTMMGKAMRASSYDKEATLLMGIDLNRIISFTFAIGAAEAGAAGVMWALVYPMIDPYMGLMPGIKAFVAAVVGGIGSVPGALIGGYLLGAVETATAAFLPSMYRDALAFSILVIVLVFKPTGLFGVGVVEKV
ncbi:MAG: branched-chain amino acid ABC transporter permease [Anaerolineales bacterium]|nr:branched-chain amino acid ABC transporter permease [Anaerolineales bacterium]